MSDGHADEEAYFKAQLHQESRREAEIAEHLPRPSTLTRMSACIQAAWAGCGSICATLTCRSSCCRSTPPSQLESLSSASSLPPPRPWYAALCPSFASCCCCCCCWRRPGATAPTTSDYIAVGSAVPIASGVDDDRHLSSVELQSVDAPLAPLPPLHAIPPTISTLPVLPSVEKQQASNVTIPAPTHEIANKTLFARDPPQPPPAQPILSTDSPLLLPLDSQQKLELELSAFYSDVVGTSGPQGSDDALTDDDDDDVDVDVLLDGSSDEDIFDPLSKRKYARERSLEQTPAERRMKEAKLAEKKRARQEELKAKQLPKEMPMPPVFAAAATMHATAAAGAIPTAHSAPLVPSASSSGASNTAVSSIATVTPTAPAAAASTPIHTDRDAAIPISTSASSPALSAPVLTPTAGPHTDTHPSDSTATPAAASHHQHADDANDTELESADQHDQTTDTPTPAANDTLTHSEADPASASMATPASPAASTPVTGPDANEPRGTSMNQSSSAIHASSIDEEVVPDACVDDGAHDHPAASPLDPEDIEDVDAMMKELDSLPE